MNIHVVDFIHVVQCEGEAAGGVGGSECPYDNAAQIKLRFHLARLRSNQLYCLQSEKLEKMKNFKIVFKNRIRAFCSEV